MLGNRSAIGFVSVAALIAGALLASPATLAQQVNGTPGSPAATTTIEGSQLPPPPQKFEGKIERDAAQSTPYWPMRVVPPKGAPNILLIMTDDTGFGVSSTFGGVIPSPTLDRIAADGLRYTNFNSTALCSPTRAAIITGRNHHSGFWRRRRAVDRLSRLQQHHDARQGDDRANPQGQRLLDGVVRQGPQHAGVPGEPGRVPFRFTGTLDKLTLSIDRPKLPPADIEKLKEATRNNRAAE